MQKSSGILSVSWCYIEQHWHRIIGNPKSFREYNLRQLSIAKSQHGNCNSMELFE